MDLSIQTSFSWVFLSLSPSSLTLSNTLCSGFRVDFLLWAWLSRLSGSQGLQEGESLTYPHPATSLGKPGDSGGHRSLRKLGKASQGSAPPEAAVLRPPGLGVADCQEACTKICWLTAPMVLWQRKGVASSMVAALGM